MSKPLIHCDQITIGYGGEDVLTAVSLSIPRGVLLPFIGPNGAGKTTLLRACLDLVPIKSGFITCHFNGSPPAYVPQQKQLDPLYPVSVRWIVGMGLYPELGYWKRPNNDQRNRIDHALAWFKLEAHQRKTFGELSGGMRQKTLLARAFVSQAHTFILDEPTAGLDAAAERDVLTYLVALNHSEGKTILLAHHRLEDLSHLAATVCLVDRHGAVFLPSADAWRHMHSTRWEDQA